MKKTFIIILSVLLVLSSTMLVSCGKKAAEAEAEGETAAEESVNEHIPSGTAPEGVIELIMWDDVTSDAHNTLVSAAESFNASQSQYHVTVQYTGSIATKVLTSTVADRPNIIQTTGNQSSQFIVPKIDERFSDPELYVPLQTFIDYDKYDTSVIVKNCSAICVRDGEWQMFPLGNTDTGVYINLDMLSAVGMTAADLKSYEDIYQACLKMKQQGVCDTPFYMYVHCDVFNFACAAEGVELFNNDNGRDGVPDQILFNEGDAKDAVLAWYQFCVNMRDNGLLCDIELGKNDALQYFGEGKCAFYPVTLSSFSSVNKVVGDKFAWQFIASPTIRSGQQNKGQSPGGRFVMVMDVDDPWKEYGSWLFVKYLMNDDTAAHFAYNVGYTPTTVTAVNVQFYKEYLEEYPFMQDVIDAQNNTEYGITMPLLPYQSDYASTYNQILKKLCVTGSTMTAQEALDSLYTGATDARDMYFLQAGIIL